MRNYNWEKFKTTGKILDYMNYTSCTNEESVGIDSMRNRILTHESEITSNESGSLHPNSSFLKTEERFS